MSDPVSALQGQDYQGFAFVCEAGLRGMITLRGDLASKPVAKAVKAATGVAVPGQRGIELSGDRGAAWMSPDELLILVPYEEVQKAMDGMTAALGTAHALVVNVSDARAVFRLDGEGTRDVLAKLAPVDLSVDAFQPGMIRRSRIAQVPAAFWLLDEARAEVVCFRSVAQYVFDLLKNAAQPGSEVGWR